MLDILRKNADAIRQAEMAFLLHDLDKMRPEFLENSNDHAFKQLYQKNKQKYKYLDPNDTVPKHKRERWNEYHLPERQIEFKLTMASLKTADVDVVLSNKPTVSLGDVFVFHHDNDPKQPFPLVAFIAHAGLAGCDGIDSEMDKNAPDVKQVKTPFKIDTPFGVFQREWASRQNEVVARVNGGKDKPRSFRDMFSTTLGETRWPCNDVTLWAHSFSVASLGKATLAKVLIEATEAESIGKQYELPLRGEKAANQTDFAFCKVTFDRDFMLARAQKAGDVVGIVDQIERLRHTLRDFFEEKVLAGNEAQRTWDSQLFLLPNLGTWIENDGLVFPTDIQDRFEKEIEEVLDRFIVTWLIDNNCHELPFAIEFDHTTMPEGEDKKDVAKRLLARSRDLQQRIPVCRQSVEALLNIRPDNGLRCEVCGVRAVVHNSDKADEKLCDPCSKRRHDKDLLRKRNPGESHLTSDLPSVQPGNEDNNKLVLFHLQFDLASIQDGSAFAKIIWENRKKKEKKNPSPGRLHRAYEALTEFLTDCRDTLAANICPNPVFPVTLGPTPDCMEFVVAGEKTDALVSAIYDEYEKRFGKFRECLPFSIGCILFKKKFPLYAALDVARGLRVALKPLKKTEWTVKESSVNTNGNVDPVILRLGMPDQGRIAGMAGWAEWRVPWQRSDGEKDVRHPVYGGKHVCDLRPGDGFEVREGRFGFLFLDSTTRRFAFSDQAQERRVLGTWSAYPLSAIRDFQRTWALLRKLSHSQISAIEGALIEKMQMWGTRWGATTPEQRRVVETFCRMVLFSPNAFGRKNRDGIYKFLDSASNAPRNARNCDRAPGNNGARPENCDYELLLRAAVNGLLLDVVDLFVHLENNALK